MKISYLFMISLLYVPLMVTNASAACEVGATADRHLEHSCTWEQPVKSPCPPGYCFRNTLKDCAKCEEGYVYNKKTENCQKSE